MGARLPNWQPSVADCVEWLKEKGLTEKGHSLKTDPARDPLGRLNEHNQMAFGVPSHRRLAGRMRKADRDLLQKRYRDEHGKPQFPPDMLERLWN